MDVNLTVASLIGTEGAWNMDKLRSLFPVMDVTCICSYPPSLNCSDSFVWAYTKDGNYSLKSGNWLVSQELYRGDIISPEVKKWNQMKNRVWSLKTEPKIRMIRWRALSGGLAVAVCLNSHGLRTDLSCKLCRSALESISHVLFECIPARAVWSNSNNLLPRSGFSINLLENFCILFDIMEDVKIIEKLRLSIPWLLWGLWKHRNVFVFEGIQGDINNLISSALEDTELFLCQQEQVSVERRCNMQSAVNNDRRWCHPGLDLVKCNIHSSWSNANSMCGGASIIRTHSGEALFHARDAFTLISNRIAAELRCLVWVLQSLRDLNIDNFEIWSDCAAVVDAVNNRGNWPLFRIYVDQIYHLFHEVQSYKFCVSSFQANSIAREIAKSVTRDGRFRSYLSIGSPTWL